MTTSFTMCGADRILEAERALLAALCAGGHPAAARRVFTRLRNHRFRDGVHQVVFEALREIRSQDPRVIREQLPALLTRKGFPDADLAGLFDTRRRPARSLAQLVQVLLRAGLGAGSRT